MSGVQSIPSAHYAGDVSPQEAWRVLSENPKAQLIDVRTSAEWQFVGLPDLSPLGRRPLLTEWQMYPGMDVNTDFAADTGAALSAAGVAKDAPLFLLCRSGARSRSAAAALTAEGYSAAYNVSNGFEGDSDAEGHRGSQNGWKAVGLPWRQG
jgi:rhodanese-related sulfurtransferase